MSSFTSAVNESNVTLNWQTSREFNNSGFDIERSGIANQWSKAGFIKGTGNSNIPADYSFTDKNLSSGKYKYRLKQIDFNGSFKYYELQNEVVIGVPVKFNLSQNYPNPFNPVTKIDYDIPVDAKVKITMYDVAGREVMTLVNELKSAGYYSVDFNGSNLASGVYFYRLEADSFIDAKKMMIVK